jgi:folylpolyglutamate synthase/dihydropteroate synthase
MADKEYREMIRTVAPSAGRVFTVKPDNPRSLDPAVSAALFRENGVPAEECGTVEDGVRRAFAAAEKSGLPVLIMGTLYMYAEAATAVLRERETL